MDILQSNEKAAPIIIMQIPNINWDFQITHRWDKFSGLSRFFRIGLWGIDIDSCNLQLPLLGVFVFYQVVEGVVFDGKTVVGAAAAYPLAQVFIAKMC